MRIFRVVCAAVLFHAQICHAVIIANPTGASNTTAPADDPGFYNVGTIVGQGTGVYLGSFGGGYWVLTANHVGGGTFRNWQNGLTYSMVSGSYVQLRNPEGTLTDLGIFRIDSDPGLQNLAISASAPPVNGALFLAGAGRAQETTLSTWNSSWVLGGNPTTYSGYRYLSPANYPLTWGTNNLNGTFFGTVGSNQVHLMSMDFDGPAGSGPNYEAMGATGDSGGAVFYKNGSQWELSGIMLSISNLSGQPSSTAVFGDMLYAAELSFYRSQIMTNVIPEPQSWAMTAIGVALCTWALTRRRRSS